MSVYALTGRKAVDTGGARGLGKAIARARPAGYGARANSDPGLVPTGMGNQPVGM